MSDEDDDRSLDLALRLQTRALLQAAPETPITRADAEWVLGRPIAVPPELGSSDFGTWETWSTLATRADPAFLRIGQPLVAAEAIASPPDLAPILAEIAILLRELVHPPEVVEPDPDPGEPYAPATGGA